MLYKPVIRQLYQLVNISSNFIMTIQIMFVDVLINHLQSIIKISCNIINLLSIFLNLVATKVNKLLQLHHK